MAGARNLAFAEVFGPFYYGIRLDKEMAKARGAGKLSH
jgi:hypothetical protein